MSNYFKYSSILNPIYCVPHSKMDSRRGINAIPASVNEYSTFGGTSAYTTLLIILFSSRSLRCFVMVLGLHRTSFFVVL